MNNPINENENLIDNKVEEYELCLLKVYGAVIRGKTLHHVLGYPTADAFHQAVRRKQLPIPTFIPEGGRVHMARTHDIAKWLASLDGDMDDTITVFDQMITSENQDE